MSKKSDIGHYARIPLHVARADVSETAKGLWREFAYISSPQVPTFWVKQENFAQKLKKSVKTVQRALKELAAAGLIKCTGWMYGRYKTYVLAWKKFFAQDGQECHTTSDTHVVGAQTPMSEDVRQECPRIIREVEKRNEQNNSFSEMAAEHVQKWQDRFRCLDGKNGRPTLKECIEQAMAHKSRFNYDNPIPYLENWLRKAASHWMVPYQQELAVAPRTAESYRAWEEMRAKKQEEDFARYWPLIQERDRKREEERRIELGLSR